jgi:uncharacterized membrane protein YgcG
MDHKNPCPKCGNDHIIGVQYGYGGAPYHYDGISEFQCSKCDRREGRWCGKELVGDEVEPPYCKGTEHPELKPDEVVEDTEEVEEEEESDEEDDDDSPGSGLPSLDLGGPSFGGFGGGKSGGGGASGGW